MDRRKFLGVSIAAAAALIAPVTELKAVDFRATSPKAFAAEHVPEAIKEMFGTAGLKETDKIKFTAPKLAENGGSIPLTIQSDLDLESIAIFQDANPRSTTAVFTIPKDAIIDYEFRIKLRKTAVVTIVAKGRDGVLYTTFKEIDVSIGGCGG
ncbi:MAG: thiosulfate oxidation carrier protein SoxY [Campylobacterales bacterium]|nr:thiosulfate oxidation carrier protein SoxY [Campylobacterales bacterium]